MRFRQLFTPSFGNRLRLFFVVIVIVPMIAVGLVLFRLVPNSEESQTDAQLGKAQQVVANLYETGQQRAESAAVAITRDEGLVAAIRARDATKIQNRLDETARTSRAARALLTLEGQGTFEAGRAPAVAPARKRLVDQDSRPLGDLVTSVYGAMDFAELVSRVVEVELVVAGPDGVLAATLPTAGRQRLPGRGSVIVDGVDYRAASFRVPAFDGDELTLRLLIADSDEGGLLGGTSLIVLGVLLGFLVLAFAFALTVSRTLQAEIKRLLDAAGALGKGDFSVAVPAQGNDEFARLGKEFNSMARQLEARLEELQRERTRLQEAIRRVGESFAAGLDRVGLLEIVVQTAVDGIGADAGRVTMRRDSDEGLHEVARTGDPRAFGRALHAAEAAVMDAGQMAEIQLGGASALAAPLGSPDESGDVVGIVSLARAAGDFTLGERELFSYLTNQASLSVENVDLHETVQRQAVTDELTGLFNHRRFQEVMASEVERARRYGQQMGLIMLDIDNFKRVNDTYGHMQGDMVLREVARVLRQSSREIDEPARYGGEEMAVALPQTDIDGAYRFAERVRRRIEALELPLLDGDGSLRVTASFGAASLATAGEGGKDALVAAADAALYRAKRSGKNRTVRAE